MTSSKDQTGNTLQLKKIEYCNTFNGTFFIQIELQQTLIQLGSLHCHLNTEIVDEFKHPHL